MTEGSKMIGVKATVTLTKTVYLKLPESVTDDKLKEVAEKEIKLPTNSMSDAANALRSVGIQNDLDLKFWEISSYDFSKI